jgi:dCMP deaminase
MPKLNKWDVFFMGMAQYMASASKDPSTKTGAVFVSPDKTDVVLGFNGFPKRMKDSPERYANREDKYIRIIHCEMNAVLHAKRDLTGYTLYTWPFLSCDRCSPHMIEVGIARAVAPKAVGEQKTRWEPTFVKTRSYFAEAGIEIIEYDLETLEYERYMPAFDAINVPF